MNFYRALDLFRRRTRLDDWVLESDFLGDLPEPSSFLAGTVVGLVVLSVFLVVLDGLLEHVLELGDALVQMEGLSIFDIFLGKSLLFLGMVVEVFDALLQGMVIPGLEKTALVQGEMVRGRHRGIRNDGNKSAGEGFDAGNGLALGIGGMDIEIGHVDESLELLLIIEGEDARILEIFPGEFLVLLAQRTLATENKLNLVVVAALSDGLDEKVLPLLAGIASDHDDNVFSLKTGILLDLLRCKEGRDTVGNRMDDVMVMMPDHLVGHHLGGRMDVSCIAIEPLAEKTIYQGIDWGDMAHVDVVGNVLGLAMESRGDGDAHDLGDHADLRLEMEWEKEMDDIRSLDEFGDFLEISIGKDHAIVENEAIENRDVIARTGEDLIRGKVIMLFGNMADDANLVSPALKIGCRPHAGDGRAIVGSAEVVDN